MPDIGKHIKILRENLGWTQNDLAAKSGVDSKYISSIERGRRNPGSKTMSALCAALMTDEQTLRFGDVPQPHNNPLKLIFGLLSPLSESELWEWHLKIRKEQEALKQEPT